MHGRNTFNLFIICTKYENTNQLPKHEILIKLNP